MTDMLAGPASIQELLPGDGDDEEWTHAQDQQLLRDRDLDVLR
jgi:hypothetical protein